MRSGVPLSGSERNVCFLNLRSARSSATGPHFAVTSGVCGFDFLDDGRGVANLDFDFDGDQDLWLSNRSGPQVRLLRNDLPAGRHFLALKLQGVSCNRDAIGARVELVLSGQPPLVRSLRAGEGFLSQSTKWLHFGLGETTAVQRLIVHWPGGKTQTFNSPEVDRFYQLTEGETLSAYQPPIGKFALSPSANAPPGVVSSAAVFLSERLPLLKLPYQTWEGQRRHVAADDKPLLLILWTSACPACLHELKTISRHAEQLKALGVDVLALTIDGVGQSPGELTDAKQLMEKINFPFAAGQATQELFEKLSMLHQQFLYRPLSLPVPFGVLIDRNNALVAEYRGVVRLNQLAKDLQLLASLDQRSPDSLSPDSLSPEKSSPETGSAVDAPAGYYGPFAGRRLKQPVGVDYTSFLAAIVARGWLDDADEYFRKHSHRIPKDDRSGIQHHIGSQLLAQGDTQQAADHFDEVIQRTPTYARAWSNKGVVAHMQRDLATAERCYRKAMELDQDYIAPRENLGRLLLKQDRSAEAIEPLQEAIALAPKNPELHFNLASALAAQRKLAEAKDAFGQVLRLVPGHRRALISQAKVLFLLKEYQQAEQLVRTILLRADLSDRQRGQMLQLLRAVQARRSPTNTPTSNLPVQQ